MRGHCRTGGVDGGPNGRCVNATPPQFPIALTSVPAALDAPSDRLVARFIEADRHGTFTSAQLGTRLDVLLAWRDVKRSRREPT